MEQTYDNKMIRFIPLTKVYFELGIDQSNIANKP